MGLRLPPGMIPSTTKSAPQMTPVQAPGNWLNTNEAPAQEAPPTPPAEAPAGTQMLTAEPSEVKAPPAGFTPEVKAQQARDWTIPYLKTTRESIEARKQDLENVPPVIRKPYDDAIKEIDFAMEDVVEGLRAAQASNLDAFEKEKAKIGWLKVAETLALNMTKVFAGIHGLRSGQDLVSGLAFNPYDWQQEMQQAREELKTKNTAAQKLAEETLGLKKAARKDKQDVRDASLKDAMQTIRDRIQSLERREGSLMEASGNIEQFNVMQRQRAGEKTEELQTRVSEGEANRQLREELALMKAEVDKLRLEKQAKEEKQGEALKQEKEVEKEREGLVSKLNSALTKASPEMSPSDVTKGRSDISTLLIDAGASAEQAASILKEANSRSGKWFPDVGSPEIMPLSEDAKSYLQTQFNQLLSQKASGRGAAVKYVSVRRKDTGAVKRLPEVQARALLSSNPDTLEVVSESP